MAWLLLLLPTNHLHIFWQMKKAGAGGLRFDRCMLCSVIHSRAQRCNGGVHLWYLSMWLTERKIGYVQRTTSNVVLATAWLIVLFCRVGLRPGRQSTII